jgi:hypothetical protein
VAIETRTKAARKVRTQRIWVNPPACTRKSIVIGAAALAGRNEE